VLSFSGADKDFSSGELLMDIFQFLWNFFFGSFEWVLDFIKEWYSQATDAGFSPNEATIICITIFLIVVIGSGLTAITVAELRNRKRSPHFILGILFPVAYPVLLYFILPEFKILSKEEKELEKMVASMPDEEGMLPESELKSVAKADIEGGAVEIEIGVVLDQQYFGRVSRDESGNPNGPFMIEMKDGRILEIKRISGALQDVVAVEIGQESGESKTIRLPYKNITSCRLKEEWLSESENDVDYEDDEGES